MKHSLHYTFFAHFSLSIQRIGIGKSNCWLGRLIVDCNCAKCVVMLLLLSYSFRRHQTIQPIDGLERILQPTDVRTRAHIQKTHTAYIRHFLRFLSVARSPRFIAIEIQYVCNPLWPCSVYFIVRISRSRFMPLGHSYAVQWKPEPNVFKLLLFQLWTMNLRTGIYLCVRANTDRWP